MIRNDHLEDLYDVGKKNYQAIQANMEKKGNVENRIEVYCTQWFGKHQATWRTIEQENNLMLNDWCVKFTHKIGI